jgi:predicted dehydrogenase
MLGLLEKYLDVKIYYDYKKMIDYCALDFVVISTPSDSHSEIIKYALNKNLHIFCEKPFGLKKDDGREILNTLNRKNIVNQVGYVNRYNEIFVNVKRLLDKNAIGEVKNFNAEMYGAIKLDGHKKGWRVNRKTGGGCLYELASHCIDLIVFLFGKPDHVIGSILQNIYSKDVEDLVSSSFTYNMGFSGTLKVNWSDESFRKPSIQFKIYGTQGKIIADKYAFKIFLNKDDPAN